MPRTSKPKIGAITWTDLTVKPAVRVRDFYAAVVGWKFSEVDSNEVSLPVAGAAARSCACRAKWPAAAWQ